MAHALNDTPTGNMANFVHAKPFDVSNLGANTSGSGDVGMLGGDAHFHRHGGISTPPASHPIPVRAGLYGSGSDLAGMMGKTNANVNPCPPLPSTFLPPGIANGPQPSTIHSSAASSNSSNPDMSMLIPSQTHSPAAYSPIAVPAASGSGYGRNAAWSGSGTDSTSPMLFTSPPMPNAAPSNAASSGSGNAAVGGIMALAGMLTLPQRCIPPHSSAPGSYYEHLNVKRTATRADIEAAYKRWRNGGYRKAQSIDPVRADTLDRVIVEATLVLSNEGFRTQYDNYLN